MTALALDVGGTKIAAARFSEDGSLDGVSKVPTPESDVWSACAKLLREVAGNSDVTGIGISSAGPVDTTAGVVSPINIDDWDDGFAIVDAAKKVFPKATVRMAMDGSCATLAEHLFGAAKGVPDVLGMVVSTGIGGGLVLGGEIVHGRTGNAGHVGHIVVPGSVDECACGGVGCVEAVASGPSSVRWAQAQGWTGTTGVELSEAAGKGEAIAVAALQRAGTAIGQAIASACALVDVNRVVIGGGFAQAGDLLWDPLRASLRHHARLSFIADVEVVPAGVGSLGSLVGAGALTLPK